MMFPHPASPPAFIGPTLADLQPASIAAADAGCTCDWYDDGDGENGPHVAIALDDACPLHGDEALYLAGPGDVRYYIDVIDNGGHRYPADGSLDDGCGSPVADDEDAIATLRGVAAATGWRYARLVRVWDGCHLTIAEHRS